MKKIETFSSHPSIREKLKLFSSELTKLCKTFEESETQTNNDCTEDNMLDDVLSLTDESMGFILQNIWQNLKNDDRESFLFDYHKVKKINANFWKVLVEHSTKQSSILQQKSKKGPCDSIVL